MRIREIVLDPAPIPGRPRRAAIAAAAAKANILLARAGLPLVFLTNWRGAPVLVEEDPGWLNLACAAEAAIEAVAEVEKQSAGGASFPELVIDARAFPVDRDALARLVAQRASFWWAVETLGETEAAARAQQLLAAGAPLRYGAVAETPDGPVTLLLFDRRLRADRLAGHRVLAPVGEDGEFEARRVVSIDMLMAITGAGWHAPELLDGLGHRWTGPGRFAALRVATGVHPALAIDITLRAAIDASVLNGLKLYVGGTEAPFASRQTGQLTHLGLQIARREGGLLPGSIDLVIETPFVGRFAGEADAGMARALGVAISSVTVTPLAQEEPDSGERPVLLFAPGGGPTLESVAAAQPEPGDDRGEFHHAGFALRDFSIYHFADRAAGFSFLGFFAGNVYLAGICDGRAAFKLIRMDAESGPQFHLELRSGEWPFLQSAIDPAHGGADEWGHYLRFRLGDASAVANLSAALVDARVRHAVARVVFELTALFLGNEKLRANHGAQVGLSADQLLALWSPAISNARDAINPWIESAEATAA